MPKQFDFDLNKLDVNKLLRGDNQKEKSRLPSELYQIVVFYSVPVNNELKIEGLKERIVRKDLANKAFIFPFYSQQTFVTDKDATSFIPMFIKQLIKETKLPPEVINEDRSLNENMIQVALVPLSIVFLERDDEFKKI